MAEPFLKSKFSQVLRMGQSSVRRAILGTLPHPPDLEVGDLRQRADSNLFPQPQNHDRRAGKGKIEDPSIHEPLSYQGVRKSQSPMAIHIEGRVTPCTTPILLLCVTLSCKPLYCSHREYVCRYLNFNNNFNIYIQV